MFSSQVFSDFISIPNLIISVYHIEIVFRLKIRKMDFLFDFCGAYFVGFRLFLTAFSGFWLVSAKNEIRPFFVI